MAAHGVSGRHGIFLSSWKVLLDSTGLERLLDWRLGSPQLNDSMACPSNGHEFEQTLGDSEGWGSLACCSPWVARSQTRLSD